MSSIEELEAEAAILISKIKEVQKQYQDKSVFEVSDEVGLIGKGLRCRRVMKGHINKVYAIAWCKSTGFLVSASQDGKLFVWKTIKGTKTVAVDLESQWVMSCAYSDSGKLVASGGLDNICTLHNVSGGQGNVSQLTLDEHSGFISSSKFIDDNYILTSSGDSTVLLWDIERQEVVTKFLGHEGSVECLDIFSDNKTFISGGIDATAKLWDINSGTVVREFRGHERDINDVTVFPNNQGFSTASDDGSCNLFDVRTDVSLAKYNVYQTSPPLTSCDFSKSGRLLFAGAHTSHIFAFDTLSGNCFATLQHGEGANVTCLTVSPDGYVLASSGWSEVIKLWGP
eukprot:Awhi_evm1s15563